MRLSRPLEQLKGELIDSICEMDQDELSTLIQSVRLSSIRSSWTRIDVSTTLPEDAITLIGSYLDASDLCKWQACSKSMMYELDILWRETGIRRFGRMVVDGEYFRDADCYTSWFSRFVDFSRAIQISCGNGVMGSVARCTVRTTIPFYRKISCTLPAMFSVPTSGSTFIEMTVQVKFSPEAVRSVVGLIEAPVSEGDLTLNCDRGLSRKHWGLAFGPLTGVVSTQGRYFDDFQTYRARHGLKDYLALALHTMVSVRVGIFIDDGRVAFYRLPEADYADWECTGYVYLCKQEFIHPCLMFSHIGHRDRITVSMDKVGGAAPFYPHVNQVALNWDNWKSFAEDGLEEAVRPPPNSPSSIMEE